MSPSVPFPRDSEDKLDPIIPVEILHMDNESLMLYKKALRDGKEKVYNCRVMVVGQFGVGKTTLTKRLLGHQVDISERMSTEGIDVYKHCCKISLDTGEWIAQQEDSDKLSTLQRLMKLLSGPDQKSDVSQVQEGDRDDIYQREPASEDDITHSNDTSASPIPDQEVKLEYSQPAELSVIKVDGGHGVEHSDQTTSTVTVPVSKAKSSEKVKKKDAVMEIIHLINEHADKLEKDTVKYAALSIWDFAGQYAFYTTHQTFLTSRALYLLVIDLNQQITDLIDDKCFLDMEGIKPCKVHDLVEIWMNSIHTCAPSLHANIPHVILVGTHVDKLSEKSRKDVIDKYFKGLRYILKDKPTIRHLMDDIAIDNTHNDPMLETLKRRIFELASEQSHWGEETPARWIPLEQAIMTLKDSGVKVVARSLIEDMNSSGSVRIEDREELDLFLRFHHEMGTILYFSVEALRENIVLDPQWLINALKSLITAETFIRKKSAITSQWYEFEETGKLTHELIDAIWTKKENPDFHDNKEHILLLMEKLSIIAMPRSYGDDETIKEENYFLVPCMLHQATPKEIISPESHPKDQSTSVLCFMITEKFLPPPVFHRLIGACLTHWPIAKQESKNLIYCGCCIFDLDLHHRLTLYFRNYVVFAQVTGSGVTYTNKSSERCREARKFIFKNLSELIGNVGNSLQLHVQCPDSDADSLESLIPVSHLKMHEKIPCRSHKKSHILVSQPLLKFWFKEKGNQGEEVEESGPDSYAEGKTKMDREDGKEKGYKLEEDIASLTLEDHGAKQKGKQQQIGSTLLGSTSEIPIVFSFTAKDLLAAWQSVENYLLEELAPTTLLTFFENKSLLSVEDCKNICRLTRREMTKEVLLRIKANLPKAFVSFIDALNGAKQLVILHRLRQLIRMTHDPKHMSQDDGTNAVVPIIAYYTLKMELLKDGKVLHETESKTRAYFEEGNIVFDYEMRSQCIKWEAGSVIIYLRPLSKSTKETLEFFCQNGGIKDFVLDLLKKKDVFSSLPEGEMSIQVQVHSYDQDSKSEGADELYRDYTQMIDKHSLSQHDSFTITDDPRVIKENLRHHFCLLVEEIEPLYIIGTFETRGLWDTRFFEELKMLKERKKRAAHFLRKVVDGGNTVFATLIHALRNNNYDYLADKLCITAKTSSHVGDKGQVDSSLIEVVQEDSATHAHESMIWSCNLVVEVRKNKEETEGQKRRLKDDHDGPASKKVLSESKGAHGTTSTDNVMVTKSTEAKRRHNLLYRKLNGIITNNPLTDIKQMARTYLDRTRLEKVESMDDLLSALEDKGKIAVGNYDVLVQIMTDADVGIGMDEIYKAAEDIKDILDS